jgi:protein ImuB
MSIVCLWNPDWRIGEGSAAELVPLILEEAPRVVVEGRGVVWVDGRGLSEERLGRRLLERLEGRGVAAVRVGIGAVPVVAESAALVGAGPLTRVERGKERVWLAPRPLTLLTDDERLLALLEGAGVRNCGELGALPAEAVEVRFGHEGTRVWKLARADDQRILFRPIPPERPHAAVDFVDYTVRDATRLVFTLNALLDQVCGMLRERARRARGITLTFTLSGGGSSTEVLRTARPTADRSIWMRRLRAALDGLELRDAISGVALEVEASEPISALQGDLFDRGFATASFVEEAVTRLLDVYRGLFVRQVNTPHPLAERRIRWVELAPHEVAVSGTGSAHGSTGGEEAEGARTGDEAVPSLDLQLLPEPRPIRVRSRTRRDHVLPVRYLEKGRWHDLTSAGPDRISGGHEESRPYAREYYRCVSDVGALLWIFRDAVEDRWFLHGWWG